MLNRLVKKVPNLLKSIASTSYYRPQRSFGKVMFSQVSVILFTGGLCVCGRHPPGRHPLGRHPTGQTPPGQTPPCPVHARTHTPPDQCMLGYTPCPRQPVQRTVRILLECRNNLQFIGVCIMICVNASHHWAIMTSGVFILVDLDTMFIVLLLIKATYVIFHNMS